MKKYLILSILIFASSFFAQSAYCGEKRPKLVVGIIVDQMRWDYLYRFQERYTKGGFKRLLREGFSFENVMINYLPSFTAVGHASIFTGSVPAIHGIAGNDWIDQASNRYWYCTEDTSVNSVGCNSSSGKMSPNNLLSSTITDELRISSNFKSKVVGISIKDRAAILPAGHNPTAAFWLDDETGKFITSSWYMNRLPDWVNVFNQRNRSESLLSKGWNTLYPINTYHQSSPDDVLWEGRHRGEKKPVFPHDVASYYKANHSVLRSTPFGNTLTLEFAFAAIEGYNLGKGSSTDFLTLNFASTDYAGHFYGPNSIEIEDVYLRLDKEIALLLSYLDKRIGKSNYLIFLTADHGAAHSVNYLQQHQMHSGLLDVKNIIKRLDSTITQKYKVNNILLSSTNYLLNFDLRKIEKNNLDFEEVKRFCTTFLEKQPGVQFAVDIKNMGISPIPESLKIQIINGYNAVRCGQIIIIPQPGWFQGFSVGTNHGTWNPYDTHIPLIFMGWNISHGKSYNLYNMTDIAPTLSALLSIQMPNGCIGKPITEILK